MKNHLISYLCTLSGSCTFKSLYLKKKSKNKRTELPVPWCARKFTLSGRKHHTVFRVSFPITEGAGESGTWNLLNTFPWGQFWKWAHPQKERYQGLRTQWLRTLPETSVLLQALRPLDELNHRALRSKMGLEVICRQPCWTKWEVIGIRTLLQLDLPSLSDACSSQHSVGFLEFIVK